MILAVLGGVKGALEEAAVEEGAAWGNDERELDAVATCRGPVVEHAARKSDEGVLEAVATCRGPDEQSSDEETSC